MDGHTALDSSVVGRAQTDKLEVVLVRLVHGRYEIEHTIHIAPTSSLNISGRLVAPDVLAQLKLQMARCKFTSVGICTCQQVPDDTAVDAFASRMSKAISQLSDADTALLRSMFLELPKPETRQMRRDIYRGQLGDGHRGQETTRFDDRRLEDERFSYRLTYLKRSDHDAGWVTHVIPKAEITLEANAALRLLGFRRFEECPEADFDACLWRAVINPNAGEFVHDFLRSEPPGRSGSQCIPSAAASLSSGAGPNR